MFCCLPYCSMWLNTCIIFMSFAASSPLLPSPSQLTTSFSFWFYWWPAQVFKRGNTVHSFVGSSNGQGIRYKVRWGEVRWGEVRWGEVRWGEVRWGEGRWGEHPVDFFCRSSWGNRNLLNPYLHAIIFSFAFLSSSFFYFLFFASCFHWVLQGSRREQHQRIKWSTPSIIATPWKSIPQGLHLSMTWDSSFLSWASKERSGTLSNWWSWDMAGWARRHSFMQSGNMITLSGDYISLFLYLIFYLWFLIFLSFRYHPNIYLVSITPRTRNLLEQSFPQPRRHCQLIGNHLLLLLLSFWRLLISHRLLEQ